MKTQTYNVSDGVAWVNGSPVPKSRCVDLTGAEARYDLDLSRISLAKPKSKPKAANVTKPRTDADAPDQV